MDKITTSSIDVQRHRYNQACECLTKLKNTIDHYTVKVKKYRRRMVVIDIVVYSVSAVVAGSGLILSTLTMTAPAIITIIVSTSTTIAGIFSIIAKKITTCTNDKLREYMIKLHTATATYSKLSGYISTYLSDGKITDEEFATIIKTYDEAFKIVSDSNDKINGELNSNNNNNVSA